MELTERQLGLLRAAGVTQEELEEESLRVHQERDALGGCPGELRMMLPVLRIMLRKEPAPRLVVLEAQGGRTGMGAFFQNGARVSFWLDGLSNPAVDVEHG